jgi:hypothetical protein
MRMLRRHCESLLAWRGPLRERSVPMIHGDLAVSELRRDHYPGG